MDFVYRKKCEIRSSSSLLFLWLLCVIIIKKIIPSCGFKLKNQPFFLDLKGKKNFEMKIRLIRWTKMAFAADADDDKDCKFVHHFNTSQERCDFVVNNTDCQEASGFLNYVTVLYCNFEDEEPLGLFLLSLWLAFLFVGLAVSADDFFCPNLHTISKTLR